MSVVERIQAKLMERLNAEREVSMRRTEGYLRRKESWEALAPEEKKRRTGVMIRNRRYREKLNKAKEKNQP